MGYHIAEYPGVCFSLLCKGWKPMVHMRTWKHLLDNMALTTWIIFDNEIVRIIPGCLRVSYAPVRSIKTVNVSSLFWKSACIKLIIARNHRKNALQAFITIFKIFKQYKTEKRVIDLNIFTDDFYPVLIWILWSLNNRFPETYKNTFSLL